jgi:hypothetical protein
MATRATAKMSQPWLVRGFVVVVTLIALIVLQTHGSDVSNVFPKGALEQEPNTNVGWERDPSETASNNDNDEKLQLQRKLEILEIYNTGDVEHHNTKGSLGAHLKGVMDILKEWGMPLHVRDAGLFHSIFGTEAFDHQCIPDADRTIVREVIGEEAEALAWIFGNMNRSIFEQQVKQMLEMQNNNENVGENNELGHDEDFEERRNVSLQCSMAGDSDRAWANRKAYASPAHCELLVSGRCVNWLPSQLPTRWN